LDRTSFFSRAPLRQVFLRSAAVIILSAGAAAHATNDGLFIGGSLQVAAIAGRPYVFTPRVVNPSGAR